MKKAKKQSKEDRNLQNDKEILEVKLSKYKQDHDVYQNLLSDYHVLIKRFQQTKRDLEAEKLLRTTLENKIVGLKKQLNSHFPLFDGCVK